MPQKQKMIASIQGMDMTWTTALNGTSKLGRVVSLLMAGGGQCNYLVRCLPSAGLHEERVRVCRRKCYRCQLGEELKTMNWKNSAVWTTLKSRLCWPHIRSPRHIHHLQLSKFWVWLKNHCDKYQWKTKSRVWYLEVVKMKYTFCQHLFCLNFMELEPKGVCFVKIHVFANLSR